MYNTSVRRRRKRRTSKTTSISLFTVCLLEVSLWLIRRKKKDTPLTHPRRISQTIFWIAILSSASANFDNNQARQYLLREQSNHTQSLILKNDWTASLKQFQENLLHSSRYLVRKLQEKTFTTTTNIHRKALSKKSPTQDQSNLLLFDCPIDSLESPKKRKKDLRR